MLRFLLIVWLFPLAATGSAGEGDPLRQRLISVASQLLDEAQVSYVYGGYQLGDGDDCQQCNSCLDAKTPAPKQRLRLCPVCARCSLDCSHFTAMVFDQAGAPYPYLDTRTMLSLSRAALRQRYKLVDLGTDVEAAGPGDLLVYDGHVVMLEKRHAPLAGKATYRGDIVHATGGRDVRGPGEGIQRERFIDIQNFRGPLRRILRHAALSGRSPATTGGSQGGVSTANPHPTKVSAPDAPLTNGGAGGLRRLRPVAKRQPNGD